MAPVSRFAEISFHVLRPMQSQLTREYSHERNTPTQPLSPMCTTYRKVGRWTRVHEPPRATLTTARRPLGESLTRLLRDQEAGLDITRTEFRRGRNEQRVSTCCHFSDQLSIIPPVLCPTNFYTLTPSRDRRNRVPDAPLLFVRRRRFASSSSSPCYD